MAHEEKIPPAGESVNEVTFIKWSKQDGELVKEGDAIAEVETDKANADLYATGNGVLKYIAGVKAGTVLKIGAVFATVDASAKPTTSAVPKSPEPTKPGGVATSVAAVTSAPPTTNNQKLDDLSPAARRAAAEGNVDVSKLAGTGPGGRITKEDIEKTGNGVVTPTAPASTSTVAAPATAAASLSKTTVPSTQSTAPVLNAGGIRRAPMSKIRKKIAENLVRAKNTTAMLTTFNEVDMSAIMKLRSNCLKPQDVPGRSR